MKLFILLLVAILPNPRPVTEDLIEDFSNQWSSAQENIVEGLELYQRVDKPLVSFFGGQKVPKSDPQYKAAYTLAKRLAQAGCIIASGGSGGILEAANYGATSVKDARMTHVSFINTHFTKKWLLLENASALVFFPAGIGTLDTLTYVLNEIDSNRLKPIPIYVMGKEKWSQIQSWIAQEVEEQLISEETAALIIFTNSIKEVEVGILEWIVDHKPTKQLKDDEQEETVEEEY